MPNVQYEFKLIINQSIYGILSGYYIRVIDNRSVNICETEL